MPVKAFFMFLGHGNQAHKNQSHYDQSGYDVLHHGCIPSLLRTGENIESLEPGVIFGVGTQHDLADRQVVHWVDH